MKTMVFAGRNGKEVLRDRLNLAFGLGFPIILMVLLSLIQSNVPVDIFAIEKLTPGIAAFGFSFIALFSGMIISKDRTSAFMLRMFTSPMKASNFIVGYTLPLIPMAIVQSIICFAFALVFKLEITVNILLAIIVLLPAALLYIGIGLLCGSIFNEKQVGGVCGALLTNVSAWLSGTWFDIKLVGGVFEKIANLLPFVHAVDAGRYALAGEYGKILPELVWVIGYAVAVLVLAILVLMRKMKKES